MYSSRNLRATSDRHSLADHRLREHLYRGSLITRVVQARSLARRLGEIRELRHQRWERRFDQNRRMHYLRSIEDRLQNHNSPARLPDHMCSRHSQLPKQLQTVGGMLFKAAGNLGTAFPP